MTNNREIDFTAAIKYWQIERLYLDLADSKGRGLSPLEKTFLQGLLCGYSPAEIAGQVYQNRNSSSVRVYLSNGLYKYLQDLFLRQTGQEVKINNWSRVTQLLEKAGYKKEFFDLPELKEVYQHQNKKVDRSWEERIEVTYFFGRETEINLLQQWILESRCRLVAVLGMAGLGKTALVVKLVEKIQEHFQLIIWRSLHYAPSLEILLTDLLSLFLSQEQIVAAQSTENKIFLLLEQLRKSRSLIVLDGWESVFLPGSWAGIYREEYQKYGYFLKRLAQEIHNSCCIFTSREKPEEIALIEGEKLAVRSLLLAGLKTEPSQQLLSQYNLLGTNAETELFVSLYANNPLVIKIAAVTITDLFNSNITEFLGIQTFLLGKIKELLDEQFQRLTAIEQKILYNLAVNQRLSELGLIGKEVRLEILPQDRLQALQSLQRRGLIGKNYFDFCQESLLKTYILQKLLEQIEINSHDRDILALVKHILSTTFF